MRHLGLNALFLEPRMGGLDTYVRELVPELVRQAPGLQISLYVNEHGREHLAGEPWAGAVRLVSHPLLGVRGTRMIAEVAALGTVAQRDGVDLLHSLAMTGPLWGRVVSVVTLADTTWIDDDSRHGAATYRMWRMVVPRAARHAARVLAISHAAAGDIVARLGVPAGRVDVTPLGHAEGALPAPAPDARERLGLPERYVLSVGTRKEHKNLVRLVQGMAGLPAALVLAGNPTDLDERLRAEAGRLGVELVLLDFVSDADLEALYAGAEAFVLASLNEGFGLPILEAMRRGLPTATSNVSALPEVAGSAGVLFDPLDVASIAGALGRLLGDAALRERLRAAGPERAAGFTWRRTAELTLQSYERAWTASRS
jgi:glycosyltransferase involved in cell wall biosynthesis